LVPIEGFAMMVSMNEHSKSFINSLFSKGIVTKQGNRYRFLFSPPLKLNIKPDYISTYSADVSPKTTTGSNFNGLWNYGGTPIAFQIDSLTNREVFGTIEFPVNRLIRKSKFF